MKKREASFQTIFTKYLRETQMQGHFELKQTTGARFLYSKIEEHQIAGLLAGEQRGLVWKYSDEDSRQKPFDCSCMPPMPGYVVIKYPGLFCIIPIKKIWAEIRRGEKSLIAAHACDLAVKVIIV